MTLPRTGTHQHEQELTSLTMSVLPAVTPNSGSTISIGTPLLAEERREEREVGGVRETRSLKGGTHVLYMYLTTYQAME